MYLLNNILYSNNINSEYKLVFVSSLFRRAAIDTFGRVFRSLALHLARQLGGYYWNGGVAGRLGRRRAGVVLRHLMD